MLRFQTHPRLAWAVRDFKLAACLVLSPISGSGRRSEHPRCLGFRDGKTEGLRLRRVRGRCDGAFGHQKSQWLRMQQQTGGKKSILVSSLKGVEFYEWFLKNSAKCFTVVVPKLCTPDPPPRCVPSRTSPFRCLMYDRKPNLTHPRCTSRECHNVYFGQLRVNFSNNSSLGAEQQRGEKAPQQVNIIVHQVSVTLFRDAIILRFTSCRPRIEDAFVDCTMCHSYINCYVSAKSITEKNGCHRIFTVYIVYGTVLTVDTRCHISLLCRVLSLNPR